MSDSTCLENEIDGPGGLRLFTRFWRGTGARGLLAIVPGFSDHGARYPHLVAAALAAGFNVASLDTRGHGRSGGRRGHVESFDEYLLDVDRFLAEARRAGWAAGGPTFIWGHSMGALITLAYLSAGFGRGAGLSAATACAPPFRIATKIPGWKKSLAKTLSHFAPTVPFKSVVKAEDLSRDIEVGRRYLVDPLVHHVSSPRLYTEMTGTASRILANPCDYGVPTIFIHGGADPLIDVEGTRSYFRRSPLASKAMQVYEGARHEVHNDPADGAVFRDVFAFYALHAPKPEAAAPSTPAAAAAAAPAPTAA